jgi:hypothetical protein
MRDLLRSVNPPMPSPGDADVRLVCEDPREARVPALRHPCRVARGGFLFSVVVNVEMVGLEEAELEAVVMHLVPPEVLRVRAACRRKEREQRHDGYRAVPNHGHPWDR